MMQHTCSGAPFSVFSLLFGFLLHCLTCFSFCLSSLVSLSFVRVSLPTSSSSSSLSSSFSCSSSSSTAAGSLHLRANSLRSLPRFSAVILTDAPLIDMPRDECVCLCVWRGDYKLTDFVLSIIECQCKSWQVCWKDYTHVSVWRRMRMCVYVTCFWYAWLRCLAHEWLTHVCQVDRTPLQQLDIHITLVLRHPLSVSLQQAPQKMWLVDYRLRTPQLDFYYIVATYLSLYHTASSGIWLSHGAWLAPPLGSFTPPFLTSSIPKSPQFWNTHLKPLLKITLVLVW